MNRNVVGNSGIYDLDPSKLTIQAGKTGLTGHELSLILREKYHLIMEMEARDYVLGMTSICDTAQGFHRLSDALLEIDAEYKGTGVLRDLPDTDMMKPRQAMAPYMAMEHKTQTISLKESGGHVSAVFVSLFPPGIPLLAPGEIIDESFIGYMDMVKREGLTVTGLCRENPDQIEVLL
jgi:arginine/lysine/ornithine decarboxylase